MKLKLKLVITFLALSLTLLLYLSFIMVGNQEAILREEALKHIDTVASLKAQLVENVIDEQLERLTLFASRGAFLEAMDKFNANRDNASLYLIRATVYGLNRSLLTATHIIDPNGVVIASTNRAWDGSLHDTDEFFIRGMHRRDASEIFKDEKGRLQLRAAGPLVFNGSTIGVIVFETDLQLIRDVMSDYTGLGDTGEIILVKRDVNGDALFLTPTRFDPDAALNRKVSKDLLDRLSVQTLLQKKDIMTAAAVDYLGRDALAASRYLSMNDWALVVKLSRSEAFSQIEGLKKIILVIGVVTAVLVIITGFIIAKSISDPIEELTAVCEAISRGKLDRCIEDRLKLQKDEIGDLARAFDRLVVSLKLAIKKTHTTESTKMPAASLLEERTPQSSHHPLHTQEFSQQKKTESSKQEKAFQETKQSANGTVKTEKGIMLSHSKRHRSKKP